MKKLTLISLLLPILLTWLGEVLPFDITTILIVCSIPAFVYTGVLFYLMNDDNEAYSVFFAFQMIVMIIGTVIGSAIFQPLIPTPAINIWAVSFCGIFGMFLLFIKALIGVDFLKFLKPKIN